MEQNYPLKSYISQTSSEFDYGFPSSPGSRHQPHFAPTFPVQRNPHIREYQQTSSGYEQLTPAYTGYEPSSTQRVRKKTGFFVSILWWLPELFASLLAAACLIAIVVVLRYYDGRPLSDVNLPHSLTLNGIIAAISTLARVALIVPVASGLSQESWIWFSNNSRRPHLCRSRLGDLDLSDNASRGAVGSLMFLLFARRRWIAYVGALTTIITLGFGTFTQQLLAIGTFQLDGNSALAPGNLPRAENWQYYNIRPSEGSQSLPLDLRAAVYNGMLTDKIDPITATCATGNCTWPITPSLAVCGGCTQTTYVQVCNTKTCTYKMPSGVQIQLENVDDQGIGYVVNSTSAGGIYKASVGDRAYIVHFDAVGAPYHINYESFNNTNVTASECALWMCVQSFSTSMVAGRLQQTVTKEFSDLKIPATQVTGISNYTFADLPAEMNPSPGITYNVFTLSLSSFYNTLTPLFNGTAFLGQEGGFTSNDGVEAIWNASTNLDPWIKNVAASLTNALRYNNLSPHPPALPFLYPVPRHSAYDGTANVLGVKVQWPWLILPVACVALSIIFLFMIMIKTANSPVAPWKSSLLTFLFLDVEKELRQHVAGSVNVRRGVHKAVGKTKAVLVEDQEGAWTFKSA